MNCAHNINSRILTTSSLRNIGLPNLRNDNVELPYKVEGNKRYLRNQITIDMIRIDEVRKNSVVKVSR